jgi:hypothetical protein
MDAFPDLQVTMEHLWGSIATPFCFSYFWRLDGTNTGPNGTGKRVSITGYEEWRISENWLITFSKGRFHEEEYKRQLEHGVEASENQKPRGEQSYNPRANRAEFDSKQGA